MPRRHLRMTGPADTPLRASLRKLRTELDLPDAFPAEVLAEAAQAAKDPAVSAHEDATDLPFLTIDPPTSTDLDQAMYLERRRRGYRVHYAIADVAAFVRPGGALDTEAHRRVTTLYFPDGRVPLHPAVLSEGAASLLPGRTRPAALWRIDLDNEGVVVTTSVHRALVRSRAKLDYAGASSGSSTPAPPKNPWPCSATSGGSARSRRSPAAASPSTCPSRRSSSATAATASNTAPRCPPTAGTPRSPC